MKIMNDIQVKAKDIVKIFSEAIKENNLELISSLLCTDGIFETQDDESNTLESDKQTFINWLSLKLNAVTIQTINYDNCLQCKMGNLVVSFNDGQFPRVIKNSSERVCLSPFALTFRISFVCEVPKNDGTSPNNGFNPLKRE